MADIVSGMPTCYLAAVPLVRIPFRPSTQQQAASPRQTQIVSSSSHQLTAAYHPRTYSKYILYPTTTTTLPSVTCMQRSMTSMSSPPLPVLAPPLRTRQISIRKIRCRQARDLDARNGTFKQFGLQVEQATLLTAAINRETGKQQASPLAQSVEIAAKTPSSRPWA
ncbi:hypothetical protein LZ31DRAFT_79095 [Colletotrichum somersetense]|nr:hypothetical protein LZ31DRAFT_79095 [Colletotrichum somersetense]